MTLTAATGVAALNIWTGSPFVALWVGSQVQGSGPPTMTSIFVVVIVFACLSLGLVVVMARLSRAHDALTGNTPSVSMHVPWLRSLRGEAPVYPGDEARLSGPERMLVVMVVLVFAVFEIWFLFFSGSPIDQRSGR